MTATRILNSGSQATHGESLRGEGVVQSLHLGTFSAAAVGVFRPKSSCFRLVFCYANPMLASYKYT